MIKSFSLVIASLLIAFSGFAQKAVAPAEFQSLMEQQAAVQLVDVRTTGEYAGGHLQGSENVDIRSRDFAAQLNKLDKTRPVFVYCLSGGRSASAARQMVSMGFTEVIDMQGGIMAWKRAGLPLAQAGNTAKPAGMDRKTYDKAVTADVPVLVNIFAPWCGPCKKMKPMLEELHQAAAGKFKYVKLNADENDALLKSLDVAEIPTFFVYHNGKQTWKHVGLVEKETLEKQLGL